MADPPQAEKSKILKELSLKDFRFEILFLRLGRIVFRVMRPSRRAY